MKKQLLSFTVFLLLALSGYAQQNVVMLSHSHGGMNISSTGKMYVKGSMEAASQDTANISLHGNLYLSESFVQNAQNPVFAASTGSLHFVDATGAAAAKRRITTSDESTFDRTDRYIAFPHVVIETDDSVHLPHRMGMDALSIKQAGGKTGALYLESKIESDGLYDASLRITSPGTSTALVDAGAVVLEKDVSAFRTQTGSGLYPFATPFAGTQLSGYFAGNWVRKPTVDASNNHHTQYVYGNKASKNDANVIDLDQYLFYAVYPLTAGQPYLLKLREKDFDYSSLKPDNGLSVTGANSADYNKDKFVLDGKVYTLNAYSEQLFADDALPTYAITANTGTTVNWVIGNSYTAAISIEKLAEAMRSSNLSFSTTIYIYSPGAQKYTPVDITNSSGIVLSDLDEIPAMGVFMLRVSKNNNATGSFKVTKDMLVHSGSSLISKPSLSPGKKSSYQEQGRLLFNQVNLRVTPLDDPYTYDMIAVGLRNDASLGSDSYDMAAVPLSGEGFNLYSQSQSGSKLSVNAIPEDTENIDLYFSPSPSEGRFHLTITNQETLLTDGLWLEDLLAEKTIDLMLEGEYSFESAPVDSEKRFKLHFKRPDSYGDIETGIYSHYQNDHILLGNLQEIDVNALISIYDMQGRQLISSRVTGYPEFGIPANLPEGVYIIKVKGERNYNAKFIKQ